MNTKKKLILINVINVLISLLATIFYTYEKTGNIFVSFFFFLGFLTFFKLIIENYGRSIK